MIKDVYLDMFTNCFVLTTCSDKVVHLDFFDTLLVLKKCGFKEDMMLLDNSKLLKALNNNLKRFNLSIEN